MHGVKVCREVQVGTLEYFCDDNTGEPIIFLDEQAAKDWLFIQGYNEPFIESLIYEEA